MQNFENAFEDAGLYPTIVLKDGSRLPMIQNWEHYCNLAKTIVVFSPSKTDAKMLIWRQIYLNEIVAVEKISPDQIDDLFQVISEMMGFMELSKIRLKILCELYESIELQKKMVSNGG